MKVVYIAGPYRARTPWLVELNIRRAEYMALTVARLGASPLCPHTNARFFQGVLPDSYWINATLELMRRSDAVMLVQGWQQSEGSRGEVNEAKRLGIPIFDGIEQLARWISEEEEAG